MNDWEELFGQMPASFEVRVDSTLQELEDYSMKQEHKNKKRPARTGALLALAAVLLMGSALAAAVTHGDFFQSVFGTGVTGQDAFTVELTDENGNVKKTESYPAVERVEVDEALAESLLGNYVTEANNSVTICGYTYTIGSYVVDENNIACITIDVDNPDGLDLKPGQVYAEFFLGTVDTDDVDAAYGSGAFMDSRDYEDESAATETHKRWVYYLTPFSGDASNADITVLLKAPTGEVVTETEGDTSVEYAVLDSEALVISTDNKVSAEHYAADGMEAWLSPVGLTLCAEGYAQNSPNELVINYADGSSYTVKGEGVSNLSVSSASSTDARYVYFAFNRLADTENTVSILVDGTALVPAAD